MVFTKKCIHCKKLKEVKEFSKPIKCYNYSNICKICLEFKQNEQKKEYDRQFSKNYCKSYYNNNKGKIRDYYRQYENHRIKNDPLFKLAKNLRQRLRNSLKAKSWKKNAKFNEYIGCSLEQLKQHLELQFTEGMTWDNHGVHGWHIDHIIPLASANNEQELYGLSHYKNLQPLWAIDNIKKSNK